MAAKKPTRLDFSDPDIREEILVRQREEMWTNEQIASLARHFRLTPGMSMLDAGCGLGYITRTFGPHCLPGGRLVGIDREQYLLDDAAKLAAEEGLADASSFQLDDICNLSLEDDTFDVAIAQVVLCHLADPRRALDELIRVTKPGGCIAIFDNAVTANDWGWSDYTRLTPRRLAFDCATWLRRLRGRKKLGRGDWSVGAKLLSWMEMRGLDDVDARANERVKWIAPPYRSAAQQKTLEHARARCRDNGFDAMDMKNLKDELRAVKADKKEIRRAVNSARRERRRFTKAMADGTAAFSWSGGFWCVWGFKPR